jgi:sugar lactone lactonase YvrE
MLESRSGFNVQLMSPPSVTAVHPRQAIEGGRIVIEGTDFPVDEPTLPEVRIGTSAARVVYASPTRMAVMVPSGLARGRAAIQVAGATLSALDAEPFVDIAAPFATGLHQVDNPVFDAHGDLYVTYSGTRGQQVPVSIFRVRPNGAREPFSSAIMNPTSMAFDSQGRLHVSSRFEGTVYRVAPDGSAEPFARDLGIACGIAFDADDAMFVGDRSGKIFRVDRDARATVVATLPESIAAFHLTIGPDRAVYVTAPTLSSRDSLYRVTLGGTVTVHADGFGRPQGLAFDAHATLFVVDALAGSNGLYRVRPGNEPELVLAGSGLIGLAFDRAGGLVVCSNETAYRLAAAADTHHLQ